MKPLNSSSAAQRGCLGALGLLWLAMLVPGYIAAFSEANAFPLLMMQTPFLLVGVGFLAWAFLPVVARTRIASPDVLVSNYSPRLGEEITLSYRQAVKSSLLVDRMTVEFVFTETARRGDGKNSSTRTHEKVVKRYEELGREYRAGETIERTYPLAIPADGMHTFITSHNKLQWSVRVHVSIPGWPDFRDSYEIKVLPEKAG